MSGRRRHAREGLGPLDELPLDGGGVERVDALELPTPPGAPRVVLDRPRLEDGRAPPQPSPTLAPRLTGCWTERPAEPDDARFEWDGTLARAQLRFPPGTTFYGGGLAAGGLVRDGRTLTFWNTDAWRYGEADPALYSSHPFALALLADGSAVGVLADATRRGQLCFARDGLEFAFEAEPFDLVRILAPHPAEAVRWLAMLDGLRPLPPLWALGYHQCRWGWRTADEVRAVARELRAREIPCDALWLDIDHMRDRRPFTFDPERFPDPEAFLGELHGEGFRVVGILDPGLPADPDFAPTAEGLEQGHFVLDAGGTPVRGRVWPGPCHFPDFTRRETREWWAGLVAAHAERGLDGIWIDMNEPALFRTPTGTLPEDARHAGDDELPAGSHARYHNLYGQLMARATREGLERARPARRPFVLSRASHLGGARFAALWTGDNQATWEDLRWTIPMVLSVGLCGQPFAGADLGGFDGEVDGELFARWFELGALLPFARGHAARDVGPREPWALGPEVEARVRRALGLRLRLLPLLYTLFADSNAWGLPVARPVFFADPTDARLRAVDDAFLLGDDVLVAPIVEPGTDRRRVLLPRGDWYRLDGEEGVLEGDEVEAGAAPGVPPVFVRAGRVLATTPGLRRAADLPGAALELLVFPEADGAARGRLYQDDGDGAPRDPTRERVLDLRARALEEGTLLDVLRSSGERDGPPAPEVGARVQARGGGPAVAVLGVRPALAAADGGRWWCGDWRGWGG